MDGIRAIAVLLVLFFHVDFAFFKAGFIGVDIFFTISGFLISGIVLREAQTTGFSFKRFYIRRATRLLPAYLFMLVVTMLVSIYVLAPLALYDFLKSALASSLFVSNFYFLLNHSGYFSTSVHELPLLHTWSLSVEEQFYLIMPITLILWLKIKNLYLRLALLGLSLLISIFMSGLLTAFNQGLSYFLVPSRIHEFLFGTVLAVLINYFGKKIIPSTLVSNVLMVISLLGIVLVSISLSSKGSFPGYTASFVCLLTMLIIYSGLNENCISHKLLGNRVFVWIGLLSYSIYLWHWPIVSFLKYMSVEFDIFTQLSIIALSFIFAWVSYWYVEKPFRYGTYSKSGKVAFSLYVLPALILCCFAVFHTALPTPFSNRAIVVEQMTKATPEEGREQCHSRSLTSNDKCFLGELSQKEKGILWGDSHASHFAPFIDYFSEKNHLKVKDTTMGNCPALVDAYKYLPKVSNACLTKNKHVIDYIAEEQPEVVFLASSWYGYLQSNLTESTFDKREEKLLEGIRTTVSRLRRSGVSQVYFFTTVARPDKDLSHCYLKSLRFIKEECDFQLNSDQTKLVKAIKKNLNEFRFVSLIDVNTLFCQEGICKTKMNSIPLYRDGNHLNRYGSLELAKLYMELK